MSLIPSASRRSEPFVLMVFATLKGGTLYEAQVVVTEKASSLQHRSEAMCSVQMPKVPDLRFFGIATLRFFV